MGFKCCCLCCATAPHRGLVLPIHSSVQTIREVLVSLRFCTACSCAARAGPSLHRGRHVLRLWELTGCTRVAHFTFCLFHGGFYQQRFCILYKQIDSFHPYVPCLERSFLIKLINTLFYYFCSELFLLKIVIHLKSGFSSYFIVWFFYFGLTDGSISPNRQMSQ